MPQHTSSLSPYGRIHGCLRFAPPFLPQPDVERLARDGPCQATISSGSREPLQIPGFAGPADGSRVDVAVIRVGATGPNLRRRAAPAGGGREVEPREPGVESTIGGRNHGQW